MKVTLKHLKAVAFSLCATLHLSAGNSPAAITYNPSISGATDLNALESPVVVTYEAAVGYKVGVALGGVTDDGSISNKLRIYFPEQDLEIQVSALNLPFNLKDFAAVVYNGSLYVIGGYDDEGAYNPYLLRLNLDALGITPGGSVETLNSDTYWEIVSSYTSSSLPNYGGDGMEIYGQFSVKNNYHLINNLLYVIGPRTNDSSTTSSSGNLFVFDLVTHSWLETAELANSTSLPVTSTGPTTTYNPDTNTIYLLPGKNNAGNYSTSLHTMYVPDLAWSVLSSQVNTGRRDATMAYGPNGSLALVGGYNDTSGVLDHFEYYDGSSTWTSVAGAQEGTQGLEYNTVTSQFVCFTVAGSASVPLDNGNFFIASVNDAGLDSTYRSSADIVVEQPTGTQLIDEQSTVDFGETTVNGFIEKTFTIRNAGFTNLTSINASLSGTHAGDFSIETAPAASIAYYASTTVTVRFTAGAKGSRAASLSISSNDTNESPFNISLSGTGIGPVNNWLSTKFTTEELADPTASGLDVDFEKDGIATGIEYILDLDPKSLNPLPWSVTLLKPSSVTYLSMRIDLPENLPNDATITVVDTSSLGSPISWRALASKSGSGEWVESNGGTVTEGTVSDGKVTTEIRSPNSVDEFDSAPSGFMQIQFQIN